MSQSKQPPKQSSGSKQSTSASNTGGTRPPRPSSQSKSQRPDVVRQPVQQGKGKPQPQQQSWVNQTFPPFSTRRYIAIWAIVMVPLLAVILWLALGSNNNTNNNQTSSAQPTATTASSGSTTDQSSTAGGTGAGAGAAAGSAAGGTGAGGAAAGGPGKYMVIDTSKGKIVAKLHTDPEAKVTNTVANFEQKATSGYFNGLNFHRVEDWVIQGGDPQGTGMGGGNMPSEYNQLPFKAGALGVARGQDPAINNDSQFFIVKTDADYLNGQYTNFGQVTEGMEIASQIAIGDKINSVTVENR